MPQSLDAHSFPPIAALALSLPACTPPPCGEEDLTQDSGAALTEQCAETYHAIATVCTPDEILHDDLTFPVHLINAGAYDGDPENPYAGNQNYIPGSGVVPETGVNVPDIGVLIGGDVPDEPFEVSFDLTGQLIYMGISTDVESAASFPGGEINCDTVLASHRDPKGSDPTFYEYAQRDPDPICGPTPWSSEGLTYRVTRDDWPMITYLFVPFDGGDYTHYVSVFIQADEFDRLPEWENLALSKAAEWMVFE